MLLLGPYLIRDPLTKSKYEFVKLKSVIIFFFDTIFYRLLRLLIWKACEFYLSMYTKYQSYVSENN